MALQEEGKPIIRKFNETAKGTSVVITIQSELCERYRIDGQTYAQLIPQQDGLFLKIKRFVE